MTSFSISPKPKYFKKIGQNSDSGRRIDLPLTVQ